MQRARFPSMPSTQGPSARWRRRTRESDPPCRRIRTIARRHPRSSFVRRRGVFPSGAGRAGAGSPCAPPAGGGTGRGNAARVASRRPPLEESRGAELLVQMSTTVKHPTLRLGVELAIGRGVDAPLGLQLSEARPDRPDPENPPPLPWEAGVRRTFTAPDAPPAALVPLACALLGAPPGHADCRSLRDRVPAVDELPHGIPRDANRAHLCTRSRQLRGSVDHDLAESARMETPGGLRAAEADGHDVDSPSHVSAELRLATLGLPPLEAEPRVSKPLLAVERRASAGDLPPESKRQSDRVRELGLLAGLVLLLF